jgi:ATP-dependent DNA ligase
MARPSLTKACKMGLEGIVSKRRKFSVSVRPMQKSWMKITKSCVTSGDAIQDGSW